MNNLTALTLNTNLFLRKCLVPFHFGSVKFFGRALFTLRNVALSLVTYEVKIFPLENTKQKFSVYFSACGVVIDTKRLDEAREESFERPC
jgi:hypothetical protein